ncbi:hypothetical protein JCM16303_007197 [Sporobolomyces ruberrimus]
MFCRPSSSSPFVAYDDYYRPSTSYSSFVPTTSLDSLLPSSYDAYDLQRSQLEQALLARRQRERREAEAAAFVARQRQLERQAAIEQAVREERERRELEEALKYRNEMIRRKQEEEELKRRYVQALREREMAAFRNEAREKQEMGRRERIEEANKSRSTRAQPPQVEQQAIEAPDIFKLLFGGRLPIEEHKEEPKPVEPVRATPSPAQQQFEPVDLFRMLFSPREVPPSEPQAKTSSSPAPAPTTPASAPAPAQVEPAKKEEEDIEAHSSDDEAATTVQRHFRRHLARRTALSNLASLSSTFLERQQSFEKPTSFTFQQSPSSTSSTTAPALAYGSANSSFLAYEDFLVNLLSKIDAVESGGDRQVKQERKSLVRKVEKELSRLDAMKERAWEEQVKEPRNVTETVSEKTEDKDEEMKDVEPTSNEEQVQAPMPSGPAPSDTPAKASLPTDLSSVPVDEQPSAPSAAPEPTVDDSVDNLEPLLPPVESEPTSPQLTKEALSSLSAAPPNTSSTTPAPRSESGSSTTSSTLTISTEDSPISDLIEQVLKRAEKLGTEVEKLEKEEASSKNEAEGFVVV